MKRVELEIRDGGETRGSDSCHFFFVDHMGFVTFFDSGVLENVAVMWCFASLENANALQPPLMSKYQIFIRSFRSTQLVADAKVIYVSKQCQYILGDIDRGLLVRRKLAPILYQVWLGQVYSYRMEESGISMRHKRVLYFPAGQEGAVPSLRLIRKANYGGFGGAAEPIFSEFDTPHWDGWHAGLRRGFASFTFGISCTKRKLCRQLGNLQQFSEVHSRGAQQNLGFL